MEPRKVWSLDKSIPWLCSFLPFCPCSMIFFFSWEPYNQEADNKHRKQSCVDSLKAEPETDCWANDWGALFNFPKNKEIRQEREREWESKCEFSWSLTSAWSHKELWSMSYIRVFLPWSKGDSPLNFVSVSDRLWAIDGKGIISQAFPKSDSQQTKGKSQDTEAAV